MSDGILIFGATRETGLEVTKLLAGRGEQITACVRPASNATELKALDVNLFKGDALKQDDVNAAFASNQFRAAVISLGGERGQVEPRPDLIGAQNVINAARQNGVQRILMVTMIGAGDSRNAVSPKVIEVLGEIIEMKTQAEELLVASDLDYTILRPGGLTSEPGTATGISTEDHSVMGVITREDLARLVVECLDDDRTIGKIYHTIDPEIKWQAPLQRGEDLPNRT